MKTFLPCLLLLFLIASGVSAQNKIYIKIDGVEGESTAIGHENEIEAVSYGNDITNCCITPGGGGGGTSKPEIGKFIFNIDLNKASIKLRDLMLKGTHIQTVNITFSKTGANPLDYYKIDLSDVLITQLTEGESALNELVKEQVSFSAGKIKWTYYPQRSDGGLDAPVSFEWDVAANTGN